MSAIKNWGMKEIYRLNKEGYTVKEIAKILNCSIEFVIATLYGAE